MKKDLEKVIVYDNGGKTLDRFTVFAPDGSVFGMSETGAGFDLYIGDNTEIKKGRHLGKRLAAVPDGILYAVKERLLQCRNLPRSVNMHKIK